MSFSSPFVKGESSPKRREGDLKEKHVKIKIMNINPSIFKSYDIRGIYPEQLNEEGAYLIGRGFGVLMQKENPGKTLNIGVSCDMRISSPALKENLIKGLLEQGINVTDMGMCSTPVFYFGIGYHKFDGGIQVTASHNPPKYNGFKLVRANSVPMTIDSGIKDICNIITNGEIVDIETKGILSQKENVLQEMIKSEKEEWKIDFAKIKPFKIVVDASNSIGALDYDEIFKDLPVELIRLNWEIDGSMPIHEANPTVDANLIQIKQAVIDNKADFGIMPDGDADRVYFIDNEGNMVRQEILIGLICQEILKEYPGTPIAFDIRPGQIMIDLTIAAGGHPSFTKAGNPYLKLNMATQGAYFGAELSGHNFFKFSYGIFEAPAVLIWKFMQLLTQENKTVSELVAPHKIYFHSGEINIEVENVAETLEKVKQKYAEFNPSLIDGVSVATPDWWFSLRGSNTEPVMRVNLEARSLEIMEKYRDELLSIIKS